MEATRTAPDQGHVALLLNNGWVFQPYEDSALGRGKPGVNWDGIISISQQIVGYQWACLPENWINYPGWDEF